MEEGSQKKGEEDGSLRRWLAWMNQDSRAFFEASRLMDSLWIHGLESLTERDLKLIKA